MPPVTQINDLIRMENRLNRIARLYDAQGRITTEYKTIPQPTPGTTECLKRSYIYNANDQIVGEQIRTDTWTQQMEDLASPPITDIQVSNLALAPGLPAGTKIGDITVVGGVAPITIELSSNPNNLFRIDNFTELTLNSPSSSGTYPITIQVTDDDGKQETQNFNVVVEAFTNEKSFLFDGVDEYINCGTASTLRMQKDTAYTLSAWIRIASSGSTKIILGNEQGSGSFNGFAMFVDNSDRLAMNLIADWGTSDAIAVTGTTTLSLNTWYHVAVTYDGSSNASGVGLYVNGQAESVTISKDSLTGNISYGTNFRISGRGGSNVAFNGHIDEPSVWDAELTQTDIQAIYNAGEATNLNSHAKSANLKHWWRMGDELDTILLVQDKVGLNDGVPFAMEALDIKMEVPSAA